MLCDSYWPSVYEILWWKCIGRAATGRPEDPASCCCIGCASTAGTRQRAVSSLSPAPLRCFAGRFRQVIGHAISATSSGDPGLIRRPPAWGIRFVGLRQQQGLRWIRPIHQHAERIAESFNFRRRGVRIRKVQPGAGGDTIRVMAHWTSGGVHGWINRSGKGRRVFRGHQPQPESEY
jgi:hypothetical protein